MKKLFILFFLSVLVTPVAKSQQIGTQSFFNAGTSGWETITSLEVDKSGNYFVAGTFSKALTINGNVLNPSGGRDIFLLKYSKDHSFLWAKSFGGLQDDNVYSLSCDSAGNLYMSGSFQGTLGIGNNPFEAKANTNVFFTRLSSAGEVQWVKVLYSNASAQKTLLQSTNNGDIWLAGSFGGNIKLDSATSINAESGLDIFLARYDANGKFLAFAHIQGLENENLNTLTVDKTGAAYLAGSYSGNINFGGNVVINYGALDMFVAKYDAQANRLWYKIAGGAFDDEAKSLDIDTLGNLYIVGDFKEKTRFGSLVLTAQKEKDIFIIKSNQSNGAPVWLKQFGSDSYNTANTIKVTNSGNIYLSGNFTGTIQNSPFLLKSKARAPDAFIACYAPDGTKKWVNTSGNNTEDNVFLSYNGENNQLFAYGYFNENLDFANSHVFNGYYKDIYFGEIIDCEDAAKLDLGNDTTLCSGNEFKADSSYISYLWSSGEGNTYVIVPEQSGLFILEATDNYGCSSADTIHIEVLTTPAVDLGEDIVAAPSDTITLSIADTLAFYLWTTGDTTHSISLPVSALSQPATIGLTAGAANGCTAYDEVRISLEQAPPAMAANNAGSDDFSGKNTENKTGNSQLAEKEKFTDYKIYPNPTNGKFYIEIPNPENVRQVDVFDSKGNHIKTMDKIERNLLKINVSNYSKGIYLIYIREENKLQKFKIIYN